jgi:elongation factor G
MFPGKVELRRPKIAYKETIRGTADVQGKYKRQSGGRGQYGDCWIKTEPLEKGKGLEFVNKIFGGAIPSQYIPAVEKGVKQSMERGVIAGYPVVDIKVTLYDGSFHDVDSSNLAFEIAGSMALRKGVEQAQPSILEPIMEAEAIVPEEFMGSVMGDLNSRRGRVLGVGRQGKKQVIRALVPQGEVFNYATDLRSLTKGGGELKMKFSHYEEVPPNVSQPLIDAYQRAKEEGR